MTLRVTHLMLKMEKEKADVLEQSQLEIHMVKGSTVFSKNHASKIQTVVIMSANKYIIFLIFFL